jgi:hypothetical protein
MHPTPEPVIPDGQLVGLSLRWCVLDLILRRVAYDRIDAVISDTDCTTRSCWESLVLLPGCHTWWFDPTKGRQFVERLIADDLIQQPRLDGDDPPEFEPGHHWIPTPI